jgi:hypothetical protein
MPALGRKLGERVVGSGLYRALRSVIRRVGREAVRRQITMAMHS